MIDSWQMVILLTFWQGFCWLCAQFWSHISVSGFMFTCAGPGYEFPASLINPVGVSWRVGQAEVSIQRLTKSQLLEPDHHVFCLHVTPFTHSLHSIMSTVLNTIVDRWSAPGWDGWSWLENQWPLLLSDREWWRVEFDDSKSHLRWNESWNLKERMGGISVFRLKSLHVSILFTPLPASAALCFFSAFSRPLSKAFNSSLARLSQGQCIKRRTLHLKAAED